MARRKKHQDVEAAVGEVRARATEAEFALRVDAVLQLLLGGAQRRDIIRFGSAPEQAWNVSDRQITDYIAAATQALEESLEKDRDRLISRELAQRQHLYAAALSSGDVRTALAVKKDLCELLGLYPAKKVEHSGELAELSMDERRARLNRVIDSLRQRGAAAGDRGGADRNGAAGGDAGPSRN